ncbi:riboflavin synthase [Salibacterium aidingense]|uniref:riboflavin synthase n=1 Tax=Salibacterium aidingense TaxID=384933 RepID=UPI0003FD7EB1|nr:riboflavin synthase [Salibacterium aidingense]
MFTGIIEEKAVVHNLQKGLETMVMALEAPGMMTDMNTGDSISVNGVCLTVTSFTDKTFTVDVMPETINATSLRTLQEGSQVNVERAMSAAGRFGGHFVSGHVDTVGTIASIQPYENAYYVAIDIPEDYLPYMVEKGSVAVDGISLTIFQVDDEHHTITLSLIPHTWQETTISQKAAGDPVNIEADVLMKYTERLLKTKSDKQESGIDEKVLKEKGFI